MDVFTLSTGGNMVQVSAEEIVGFPTHTSYFGGYDARGSVDIRCGSCFARGPLWFSTGEVWEFYTRLRAAYDALVGQARFCSSEGNLQLTITFTARGHWTLEGVYQELHRIKTRLHFEMKNDQSYLASTLAQLAEFVATYGDNRGVHRGHEGESRAES